MRILVATDAWHPQVNGVVRTLTMMASAAQAPGNEVSFLTPESFRTFALPSYRDLRDRRDPRRQVAPGDDLEVAVLVLDQRRAALHPVAAVHVTDALLDRKSVV